MVKSLLKTIQVKRDLERWGQPDRIPEGKSNNAASDIFREILDAYLSQELSYLTTWTVTVPLTAGVFWTAETANESEKFSIFLLIFSRNF